MRSRWTYALAILIAALAALACQTPTADLQYVKYNSEADVPRMNIQDAKAAVDSGAAVIVDSRPADAYKQEHIKDSINLALGVGAEEKFSTLPKGKKIIVYCS
ncbi:MAG TPA: rhodanese-like domain-containing protein [Pyrinomonadaceae bacterium]|nr:rhodanese-like domain-containing protein [Pyrinomonadaceae bacterium]